MDCSGNETCYYAVYSEKHAEYNRNKYNVSWITSIDDNYSHQRDKIKIEKGYSTYKCHLSDAEVKCTAVYRCENYISGQDVLERDYLWDDAVVVGVVDQWIRTE